MELPRGITGFDIPPGATPPDEATFRGDCWAVVAPLGGRVADVPPEYRSTVDSYYALVLELPGGPVTAILNRVHPWLGFCVADPSAHTGSRFVDPPGVAESFAGFERYRVLPAADLEQPVQPSMCAGLGGAERREMRYWAKTAGKGRLRVGDVVFNSWD